MKTIQKSNFNKLNFPADSICLQDKGMPVGHLQNDSKPLILRLKNYKNHKQLSVFQCFVVFFDHYLLSQKESHTILKRTGLLFKIIFATSKWGIIFEMGFFNVKIKPTGIVSEVLWYKQVLLLNCLHAATKMNIQVMWVVGIPNEIYY